MKYVIIFICGLALSVGLYLMHKYIPEIYYLLTSTIIITQILIYLDKNTKP